MKLGRHNKKERKLTISMTEDEFRLMYDTLTYTRHHRQGKLDQYADDFFEIWNKVCKNFEPSAEMLAFVEKLKDG